MQAMRTISAQIASHKQDFESIYRKLGSPNLDAVKFPLQDIESFNWNRGQWNDEYYCYHYRRFTAHILSRLQLSDGQKVLIVGCGFGLDEKNIASLYKDMDLWSIDISEEMLRLAIASGSPSRFGLALAERLPFGDNTFDRVLSREVIEHVINPQLMVSEIHRVLKPDGLAIVTTENEESLGPTNYYDSRIWPKIAGWCACPISEQGYKDEAPSLREMERLVIATGMTLDECFWDGAVYKYLIEISGIAQSRMARLAHRLSSLENNRRLAFLFCDQVKYVVRKKACPSASDYSGQTGYACVECTATLQERDGILTCVGCQEKYPVRSGIAHLLPRTLPECAEPQSSHGQQSATVRRDSPSRPRVCRWMLQANARLRKTYGWLYLTLAFLATCFVKQNNEQVSHVLDENDPYQRYLRAPR
jgi:ubiquinone/menaquinone biosynthesis C-methylase UbiE/uncharacterized protein YbaR (Trm112 family)